MFKRRYILILFLIIIIASISHVGAAEANDASNITSQTPVDEMEVCDDAAGDDGELSLSEETDALQASNIKTFSDLEEDIKKTTDQNLYLECDYVFNPDTDYEGCIDISKSIIIHGNNHIIDGANKNNIFGIDEGVDVVIRNVTFSRANIPESKYVGGVIYNEGRLALEYCNFLLNNVASNGSAIYNEGTMALLNCTFAYNNATNGAAVYNDGEINIRYCIFVNNTAKNGAVIYNNKKIYLSDSIIWDNKVSENGGAIANNKGTLITYNCTFLNNTAQNGGAIYSNGLVHILQNYFEKNAAEVGGAIVNLNELYVYMDSVFRSNKATYSAGAIYTDYYAKINTTNFIGNQAGTSGGAVFNPNQYTANVNNCNFTLNTAENYGGGVYNCIVSDSKFLLSSIYKGVNINCNIEYSNIVNNINSTGFELKLKSVTINPTLVTIDVNVYSKPNNEEISGALLFLSFNNKVYYSFSKNGTASFKLSNLKTGTYTYTIYLENDLIDANRISASFKLADPAITASNLKVVYSANPYYSIKVYGRDGKVAGGQSVVVKLNGKAFQTLKTDANGVAKFRITQNPGTYKLTVTSLGTTVTRTLTVNHVVTLKAVTVKRSAKKLVLTATLSRVNGKYLSSKIVTFKFNGKTFRAKTNARGIAQVTIKSNVLKTLKAGRAVTYQATYLKDTVKRSGKVYK